MYCPKCGMSLPDGTKFCSNCGASIGVTQQSGSYQQPQSQQAQTQQPQTQSAASKPQSNGKKKTPVWIPIIAAIAAFLIGKYVLAPIFTSSVLPNKDADQNDKTGSSYSSDYDASKDSNRNDTSDNSSGYDSSANNTSSDERNPAFDAVFSDNGIIRVDSLFFGVDSTAFVIEDYSDGVHMIDCIELGYEDNSDVICKMYETIYFDLRDMSDTEREQADTALRSAYDVFQTDDIKVRYHSGEWYSIVLEMNDLDNSTVLGRIIEIGAIETADGLSADWLSLSQTRDSLTSSGYIER